jgi:quercetin dioxygenase-like cupin family protein
VAADDPPAPVVRYAFRVPGLPTSGPLEVLQFLGEYGPGSSTPAHTHAGQVVSIVIEGQVTFETGGKTTVLKPGDTYVEPPGVVEVAHNTSGTVARAVHSIVIPQGAPLSIPQPGAPIPSPAPLGSYQYRTPAVIPAGEYDLVLQVLDFAPGAQTPVHTHPGQVVVTVIAGENTFTSGEQTTVYQVGDSFVELPGVAAQARNAGSAPLTVFALYLLPKGAPLSEPVAPAPPPTGTGGNLPGLPSTGAGGGTHRLPVGWLVLAAGVALVAGGWHLRRGRRRA